MRTRATVAASVVETDDFLGMSTEAQCCYLHLLLNADVCGRILAARRLVRGYGFSRDTLDELLAGGYLIDINGTVFDRHCWQNNRFTTQTFERMADLEEYACGRLRFEGAEGKSAYAIPDRQPIDNRLTTERHSNDSRLTNERQGVAHNTIQANSNSTASTDTLHFSEGAESHPCLCTRCRKQATYTIGTDGTWIHCEACGTYLHDTQNRA